MSVVRHLCAIGAAVFLALSTQASRAADAPAPDPFIAATEGDYTVHDFKFLSGEVLPELRQHYTTLGKPHRDSQGHVDNAVLILHGTGGDGHQFQRSSYAGVLFVPDGLLDPARYFIILPDGIGHGKSTKPSDGLHAKFPHYGYADMVRAQYLLVKNGLHVDHLRLVTGTSMGCMHSFVWGETYPEFMDALMPLACLPVQIAGRNRMWRKMVIEAIKDDPAWNNGEYKHEPVAALRNAEDLLLIAGSAPHQQQKSYPTRDAADKYVEDTVGHALSTLDANDLLYQVAASQDYDPSAKLETIKAPVMWINSADDFINPPELGIAQEIVKRIPHGQFVLIPISDQTHGHGTHTYAAVWQSYMAQLLKETER